MESVTCCIDHLQHRDQPIAMTATTSSRADEEGVQIQTGDSTSSSPTQQNQPPIADFATTKTGYGRIRMRERKD
jgi:hypothetical protein